MNIKKLESRKLKTADSLYIKDPKLVIYKTKVSTYSPDKDNKSEFLDFESGKEIEYR